MSPETLYATHPTVVIGLGETGEHAVIGMANHARSRGHCPLYDGFRLLVSTGKKKLAAGLTSECPFLREYHEGPADEVVDHFAELQSQYGNRFESRDLRLYGVGDRNALGTFLDLFNILQEALSKALDPNASPLPELPSPHWGRLAPMAELIGTVGGLQASFIMVEESETHAKTEWRRYQQTRSADTAKIRCLYMSRSRWPRVSSRREHLDEVSALLHLLVFETTDTFESRVLPDRGEAESYTLTVLKSGEYDAQMRRSLGRARKNAAQLETFDLSTTESEEASLADDFCEFLTIWNEHKDYGSRSNNTEVNDSLTFYRTAESRMKAQQEKVVSTILKQSVSNDPDTVQRRGWIDRVVRVTRAEMKQLDGMGMKCFVETEPYRMELLNSWTAETDSFHEDVYFCGLDRLDTIIRQRQTLLESQKEAFYRKRPRVSGDEERRSRREEEKLRRELKYVQAEVTRWHGYRTPSVVGFHWFMWVIIVLACMLIPLLQWAGESIDFMRRFTWLDDGGWRAAQYWIYKGVGFLLTNSFLCFLFSLAIACGFAIVLATLLRRRAESGLRTSLGSLGSISTVISETIRRDARFKHESNVLEHETIRWLDEEASQQSQRLGTKQQRVQRARLQLKWLQSRLKSMAACDYVEQGDPANWRLLRQQESSARWLFVPPTYVRPYLDGPRDDAEHSPWRDLPFKLFDEQGDKRARDHFLYPETFVSLVSEEVEFGSSSEIDLDAWHFPPHPSFGETIRVESFLMLNGRLRDHLERYDPTLGRRLMDSAASGTRNIPLPVRDYRQIYYLTRRYEIGG